MEEKNWRYYLKNLLTGGYLSVQLTENDIKQIEEWVEFHINKGF